MTTPPKHRNTAPPTGDAREAPGRLLMLLAGVLADGRSRVQQAARRHGERVSLNGWTPGRPTPCPAAAAPA